MMENKTFRWIAFAVSAVLAVIAIFAHTFSGFLCFVGSLKSWTANWIRNTANVPQRSRQAFSWSADCWRSPLPAATPAAKSRTALTRLPQLRSLPRLPQKRPPQRRKQLPQQRPRQKPPQQQQKPQRLRQSRPPKQLPKHQQTRLLRYRKKLRQNSRRKIHALMSSIPTLENFTIPAAPVRKEFPTQTAANIPEHEMI